MAQDSNTPAAFSGENAAEGASNRMVEAALPRNGQSLTFTSSPGGVITLGFDPASAVASREGNDLLFTLEGQGSVLLKDFLLSGMNPFPIYAFRTARRSRARTFLTAATLTCPPPPVPARVNRWTAAGPVIKPIRELFWMA